MILRIVAAILALVLVLLGVTFLVIGLAIAGTDAAGFRAIGIAALAAGLVSLALWAVLRGRAAAERGRRDEGSRAVVEVVEARLHPYVRIGVMLTMTLTVRYVDAGLGDRTFTRKVLLAPTMPLAAGDRVEVRYDPADPENFEPVRKEQATGHRS